MVLESVTPAMIAFLIVFGAVALMGVLASGVLGDRGRSRERVKALSRPETRRAERVSSPVSAVLGRLGELVASKQRVKTEEIRKRLHQAGFMHPNAPFAFTGLKILLTCLLTIAALGFAYLVGPMSYLFIAGACLAGCTAGLMGPELWLTSRVRARQRNLRHAMPDALDMLVLCLEGGMSLPAAMQSVSDELWTVYPTLGAELNIVQREMQLGLSPGDALRKFADRYDLSDVRDLAMVLHQAERYGSSLAKTLRTYADTARQERLHKLEESAQQAAVKILFPTLLFIFPAIFVVLLGPAAFQVAKLFAQ